MKNIKDYVLEKKTETPKPNVVAEMVSTKTTPLIVNPPVVETKTEVKSNTSSTEIVTQTQKPKNNNSPSVFTKSNTTILSTNTDLFQQGRNDAKMYYAGYKGAGTGTFLTTFLLSPVLGLIPAIACSSTAPNASNFTFPNSALTREPDYMSGYMQEAKKKKSGKVWGNFGIGTVLVIVAVGVLAPKR